MKQHIIILLTLLILIQPSQPAGGEQFQQYDNYGFFLDNSLPRWQEFTTQSDQITGIELLVDKTGNPGDLIVELQFNQSVVWSIIIPETNVSGWILLSSNIVVTALETYQLVVSATQNSTDINNRYYWRGHLSSNYTLGRSDVSYSYPDFDYCFIVHEKPLTVNHTFIIDQGQTTANYGYFFEINQPRWQEFTPDFDQVSRIDLLITKDGNPGSLVVGITNSTDSLLWSQTFSDNSIPIGENWFNITPILPVSVISGDNYKLVLSSDKISSSPSQRYYWRGNISSSYQGISDVYTSKPTYDYSFVTYGLTTTPQIISISSQSSALIGESISVVADIHDRFPLSKVRLYYQIEGQRNNITMNLIDGKYITNITNYYTTSWNTTMEYTIEVANINGSVTQSQVNIIELIYVETDQLAPVVTSPGNKTFYLNESSKIVVWGIMEVNPVNYSIFVNGSEIETGTYNSSIQLDISIFSEGIYNIELYVYDSMNNCGSDIIWVTITNYGNATEPQDKSPNSDPIKTSDDSTASNTTISSSTEIDSANSQTANTPTLDLPAFHFLIAAISIVTIIIVRKNQY